ncbi:bifunctional DNA primase/polymerase [Actinomadura welshii]|uniref:bifunctional DNA primase/polymerase n=1 Tax=Actinomadura welshii TaxID=3103817 RepID=UPI0004643D42|nr:bifunctional DNA primase/polymerase [Actinomadura madurae]
MANPIPLRTIPPPTAEALARYALVCAARGWHVFPLAPGDKEPPHGVRWTRTATIDPAAIRAMWARRPYNIGIACGPSRLLVIDLDMPKTGQHPPPEWAVPGVNDGSDVFAMVCEQAGEPMPLETFQVRTRRGGFHLYFTAPQDIRLTNTSGDRGEGLGWKIDTRGDGGYVVGPGSFVDLPDGTGAYTPIHTPNPAPLPSWLAERLRPAPLPPQEPVTVRLATGNRGAYLDKAVKASLDAIAATSDGDRNTTLYGAAVALGQLVAGGALNPDDTEQLLTAAAVRTGLGEMPARRTIRSGFRAGTQRPRSVPA